MQNLRLVRVLFLSLVVPTLVACGDEDGPTGVTGTYTLRTIGDDPVPAIEYEDAEWRDEILSGSIRLDDDETCLVTIAWRSTFKPDNDVDTGTVVSDCTYEIDDGTIAFEFSPDDIEEGTISGNTITMDDGSTVWIFRK